MEIYLKNVRLLNLVTGISCQIAIAVSGLILPNLILNKYGSVLYGLVSTIAQMLAYLSLVEMGIASASLVSLYKPMAQGNYDEASHILSAVNNFYKRIALIFSVGSIGCGILAIFIIKDDIPITTIWFVVIVLAGNNFVSYWLLNKYKVILQADDKLYVVNITHMIGVIVQFLLSILVINYNINIAFVKAVIIITSILEWLILLSYCRKKLPEVKLTVSSSYDSIKQRKDILIHQVLALVLNNTDVILLMLFSSSLSVVSVYTIFAMVGSLLQNVVNSFIGMFSAKMGQLYSVRKFEDVRRMLNKYEIIYDIALFTAYSAMSILIMPFISLYTRDITDTNYYIPIVGLLFSIYGISRMFRLPYTEITSAAGHFKQTKIQAIIEVSTNLIVSVVLLPFLGIPGVLIGSIVGELYRTIHSYIYCYRNLITFDWVRSIVLCFINCIIFALVYKYSYAYQVLILKSYIDFFVLAIKVTLLTGAIFILINIIFSNIYEKIRLYKKFVNS